MSRELDLRIEEKIRKLVTDREKYNHVINYDEDNKPYISKHNYLDAGSLGVFDMHGFLDTLDRVYPTVHHFGLDSLNLTLNTAGSNKFVCFRVATYIHMDIRIVRIHNGEHGGPNIEEPWFELGYFELISHNFTKEEWALMELALS